MGIKRKKNLRNRFQKGMNALAINNKRAPQNREVHVE